MTLYHNLIKKIFNKCNLQTRDRIKLFTNVSESQDKTYMMRVLFSDSHYRLILLSISNSVEKLYQELNRILSPEYLVIEVYYIKVDEIELNKIDTSFSTTIINDEIDYDERVNQSTRWGSNERLVKNRLIKERNTEITIPQIVEHNFVGSDIYYVIILVNENIREINREVELMNNYIKKCNQYRFDNNTEYYTMNYELPIKCPANELFRGDYHKDQFEMCNELEGELLIPVLFGYDEDMFRQLEYLEDIYGIVGDYYYYMTNDVDNIEYSIGKMFPDKIIYENIIYHTIRIEKSLVYGSLRSIPLRQDNIDNYLLDMEENYGS